MNRSKVCGGLAAILMVAAGIAHACLKLWQKANGITDRELTIGDGVLLPFIAPVLFLLGLFVALPLSIHFREKETGVREPPMSKPVVALAFVAVAILVFCAIGVWIAFLTGMMN